ncbi:MAG: Trk family potassium uptake protein, partial [Solobacterium sp.]|nr:Trk family potassium uptake protein [Solobacterium sp.]
MKDFRTFLHDHFTSFRAILLSFLSLIFIGAFLLCLPVCSASGRSTPFPDALFTATSAVCVTGLVVCDTAVSWSVFGKCVLLFLIQIGGLGVMTIAVAVFVLTGQRISILQRSTMRDSISAPQIGGIVR